MSLEEASRLIEQMSVEELEALAKKLEEKKKAVSFEDKLEKIREEERKALEAIEKSNLPSWVKEAAKEQTIKKYAMQKLQLTEEERRRTYRREQAEAKVRELLGLVPKPKPSYAEVPAPELIGYVEKRKPEVKKVEERIEKGEELPAWMKAQYERFKALEQLASQLPPEKMYDPNTTVKVPVESARTLGFNAEELEKVGKLIPNLLKGIEWYITGKIDPKDYEEVSAAVKTAGTVLMGASPAGLTAAGVAAATGFSAPVAGLIGGVSGALGLIGWWLSDNVAGRIDLMKSQLDKEAKEKQTEEAIRKRDEAKAIFDQIQSMIYGLRELENVADSYIFMKNYDAAQKTLESIESEVQELKTLLQANKDKMPTEYHYSSLMESLRAVENLIAAKKNLITEKNPQRNLTNAQTNMTNALKLLSDWHENWLEKKKTIDVTDKSEREIFYRYEKQKAADTRAIKYVSSYQRTLSKQHPSYTYQKSKLAKKEGKAYEDPYLFQILKLIAETRGKPTAEPEKLPDIAGLPSHAVDYPVIAKFLTWIMYNPKTPLAVMPNSYWEKKAGKEYTSLDRYLMMVALNQARVNPAEIAELSDVELEAILRFRQYMYAAMKRGYFLPWEFELYTRFKELMLVDDAFIAAIMGMEVPGEVKNAIAGEKILDVGGTVYITPAEVQTSGGV